ncbi:unnamed protein product [Blepharisma stoltei]|uniref:Ubiquitin-like domain-containing protein n=1 Tax=Blepharisma stoltei TaxID=1481888 RepID=A0AAU9IUQ3_9CILI|nr:unnamed protein product [Blepharisma stoltei]
MGGCKSRMASVKIIFAFDKKYFARWTRKQWIPKETSFRQIHKEVKNALTSLYSHDKYKVVLKFRGKIYNSHDPTTLLDLNAENGEKLSISVSPKEKPKDKTFMNIRLHCCTDEYICIFIKNGSTVLQLQEEIVKYKQCCNQTDLKIIYKHLELSSEEYVPEIEEGILDVFSNTKISENLQSPWKIKKSGLVKEGLCMNINCLAYKQIVSVNKGLGHFNLLAEASHLNIEKCGICDEKLYNTHRIGFANCVYSYKAIKNDETIQEENCKEIRTKYTEFDLIKQAGWSQLEVTVSCLPGHVSSNLQ